MIHVCGPRKRGIKWGVLIDYSCVSGKDAQSLQEKLLLAFHDVAGGGVDKEHA